MKSRNRGLSLYCPIVRYHLPKYIDGIKFELAIDGQQMPLFRSCLGNEQSIKKIIMHLR
jgi:hypothetical protein